MRVTWHAQTDGDQLCQANSLASISDLLLNWGHLYFSGYNLLKWYQCVTEICTKYHVICKHDDGMTWKWFWHYWLFVRESISYWWFPLQGASNAGFDVLFFMLAWTNCSNKKYWNWWFEMPWCPCDVTVMKLARQCDSSTALYTSSPRIWGTHTWTLLCLQISYHLMVLGEQAVQHRLQNQKVFVQVSLTAFFFILFHDSIQNIGKSAV